MIYIGKEKECEKCGLYTAYIYQIKSFRLKKILNVCPKCIDYIRNQNLSMEVN